jgi:hypothetical protein
MGPPPGVGGSKGERHLAIDNALPDLGQ